MVEIGIPEMSPRYCCLVALNRYNRRTSPQKEVQMYWGKNSEIVPTVQSKLSFAFD